MDGDEEEYDDGNEPPVNVSQIRERIEAAAQSLEQEDQTEKEPGWAAAHLNGVDLEQALIEKIADDEFVLSTFFRGQKYCSQYAKELLEGEHCSLVLVSLRLLTFALLFS